MIKIVFNFCYRIANEDDIFKQIDFVFIINLHVNAYIFQCQ